MADPKVTMGLVPEPAGGYGLWCSCYPYTLSSWTTRNGAVVVADLSGVAPNDGRVHHVAMVCHSADQQIHYVDGAEFPMWPNVPYWLRRLVWRYRVWRRGQVKG